MMVKPFDGKSKIKENLSGFKIEIPYTKNWLVIVFTTVWLIAWIAIGSFVLSGFVEGLWKESIGFKAIVVYAMSMFFVGGIYAIGLLRWQIWGKEIIEIKRNSIKIEIKNYFLNKSKTYELKECKNFSLGIPKNLSMMRDGNQLNFIRLSKMGTIKFEYGMKTISFGIMLDEAEGKMILEKLRMKGLISD